ncbi:MAG TPA: hypothetical protein VED40_21225 [Azospirillaceae bacterium]|nr:hypothetical protein [Azospirillaceae bacterium]
MSHPLSLLRAGALLLTEIAFWATMALAVLLALALAGTLSPEMGPRALAGVALPLALAGLGAQRLAGQSASPALRRALPAFRSAQWRLTLAFWASAAAVVFTVAGR